MPGLFAWLDGAADLLELPDIALGQDVDPSWSKKKQEEYHADIERRREKIAGEIEIVPCGMFTFEFAEL